MGYHVGRKSLKLLGLVGSLVFSLQAYSVQIVTTSANAKCRKLTFAKELRVFKDPQTLDWENLKSEDPILTTLKGDVALMRIGEPEISRSITYLAKLKEKSPPRRSLGTEERLGFQGPLFVTPVKLCSSGYNDMLGYVIEKEFKDAQIEELEKGTLPPSTPGNQIPILP